MEYQAIMGHKLTHFQALILGRQYKNYLPQPQGERVTVYMDTNPSSESRDPGAKRPYTWVIYNERSIK